MIMLITFITGTPIQNTVPEIGSLLNFIDPEIDITAYGGKCDPSY